MEKFKIGDIVELFGKVDDKSLDEVIGTITDISPNRLFVEEPPIGYYVGLTYFIYEIDWWVSPHNIKSVKKRKRNLEEDPWGEENWGYVQESLSIGGFHIGQKVSLKEEYIGKIDEHDHRTFDIKYIRYNVGTIVDISRGEKKYPISVDWGGGNDDISYKISELNILDDKKIKKLKNLDDDPWGEEDWGYAVSDEEINEKILSQYTDEQVIKILKKKSDKIICEFQKSPDIWKDIFWYFFYHTSDYLSVYIESKKNGDFRFVLTDERMFSLRRMKSVFDLSDSDKRTNIFTKFFSDVNDLLNFTDDCGLNTRKVLKKNKIIQKKKLNFEDDPWGEENWGYVQEEYEGGPPAKEPLIIKHIGEIDIDDDCEDEKQDDDINGVSSIVDLFSSDYDD